MYKIKERLKFLVFVDEFVVFVSQHKAAGLQCVTILFVQWRLVA